MVNSMGPHRTNGAYLLVILVCAVILVLTAVCALGGIPSDEYWIK